MAEQAKTKGTKVLHKPKRTNTHLIMVSASIALALLAGMLPVNALMHLVPALPALPTLLQELADKIIFHEDLVEEMLRDFNK